MRPAFLFPVCDDCGATLLPPNCGGASHICITPNSRNASATISPSAASISPRQARSIALSDFLFAIASAPRDAATATVADAA